MKQRILSLLTCLALCLSLLPVPVSAATTHSLQAGGDLKALLSRSTVKDGDIIQLQGTGHVNDDNSDAAPWVIDKQVTIRGGSIDLRAGGIVLGDHVTFDGVQLSFSNPCRNVIAANGYTLTLHNAKRAKNAHGGDAAQQVHLVCGTMVSATGKVGSATIPAKGTLGKVVISGSDVDLGNVYAGDIFTDGSTTPSGIRAEIDISTSGTVGMTYQGVPHGQSQSVSIAGGIYASGALQAPYPSLTLDTNYVQCPPYPAAAQCPATGGVSIRLSSNVIAMVNGATGGAQNAALCYATGSDTLHQPSLYQLSSLTLEGAGTVLTPSSASDMGENTALTVPQGTRLALNQLGDVSAASLNGGGMLVLAQGGSLYLSGAVSGTTTVAIGGVLNGASINAPYRGSYSYITAAQSDESSFVILPSDPDAGEELVRDERGRWSVPMEAMLVNRFSLHDLSVESGATDAYIPTTADYANNMTYISAIPATLTVGDEGPLEGDDWGEYVSVTTGINFFFTERDGEVLYAYVPSGAALPDGRYTLTLTIPEEYSTTGGPITTTCTLTVGEGGGPVEPPIQTVTLTEEMVTVSSTIYSGSALTPSVTVLYNGQPLRQDTDYTVKYSNNTNAGQGTVTVTGKGGYTGTVSKSFTILPKTVSSPTITLQQTGYVYDGKAKTPAVQSVKDGNVTIPVSEYTVAYENNTEVGQATVRIVDREGGNYTVSGSTTFPITRAGQKALTIIDKPTTLTYGDTFTLSTTGGTGDGAVIWEASGSAIVDEDSGEVTLVGVGEVVITATKAGGVGYEDTSATWIFTPSPKEVTATVTVAAKDYDGTAAAAVTAAVTEGLVGSDRLSVTGLSGAFDNPDAGENKTVSVDHQAARVEGTRAACYTVRYPDSATGTIRQRDISGAQVGAFASMAYTGRAQTPVAEVTLDGGLRVTGRWSAVTNVDDSSTFTATGNFTGTLTGKPNMSRQSITVQADDQWVKAPGQVAAGRLSVVEGSLLLGHQISAIFNHNVVDLRDGKGWRGELTINSVTITDKEGEDVSQNYTVGYRAGGILTVSGSGPMLLIMDPGLGSGTVYTEPVFADLDFTLPEHDFTAPAGMVFTGWLVDGVLKQPGDTLTLNQTTYAVAQYAQPGIRLSHGYLALAPGQSFELSAELVPAGDATVRWKTSDRNLVQVRNLMQGNGVRITPQNQQGMAIITATVELGGVSYSAQCRVDVIREEEAVQSAHLNTTSLSTNLYSTDYPTLNILLSLEQNGPQVDEVPQVGSDGSGTAPNSGAFVESARFVDETLQKLFALRVVDDRTLELIPVLDWEGDYATAIKAIKASYQSRIEIVADGQIYQTAEALTLKVDKKLPTVKATALKLNSFYADVTAPLALSSPNGAILSARVDESKATDKVPAIPDWLTLNDNLSVTVKGQGSKYSGKLNLLVWVEGYAAPVPVNVAVSTAVTAPKVKLSASNVTLYQQGAASQGAALSVWSGDSKLVYEELGVTAIELARLDSLSQKDQTTYAANAAYELSEVEVADGSFVLRAREQAVAGKLLLQITFGGVDSQSVTLALTVKAHTAAPTLKLAKTSATLNPVLGVGVDGFETALTVTPADYRLEKPVITVTDGKNNPVDGELGVDIANGWLTVTTTDTTQYNATYKVNVTPNVAGAKAAVLTIKTPAKDKALPTLTLTAKGSIDTARPEAGQIELMAKYTNYTGMGDESPAMKILATNPKDKTAEPVDATHHFMLEADGAGGYLLWAVPGAKLDAALTYTLTLTATLGEAEVSSKAVKLGMSFKAPTLKLAKTSATLNPSLGAGMDLFETALTVTPADYRLEEPVIAVTDGKNNPADGELKVDIADGWLTVTTTETTQYNATYKVNVTPDMAGAKAATLTVKTPAVGKDIPAVTLTVKGSIDTVKLTEGSILLTPKYTNYNGMGTAAERFVVTEWDPKNKQDEGRDVTAQFDVAANGDGTHSLRAKDSARLNPALRYTVTLFTDFGGQVGEVASKEGNLTVKQGSVKLTQDVKTVELYSNDRYSEGVVTLTLTDAAAMPIGKVLLQGAETSPFEVTELGGGRWAIGFRADSIPAAGLKGGSVKLDIYLSSNLNEEGQPIGKANATVSVTVKVVQLGP